jgi:CheY-specific phosphatase CheX
MKPRFFGQHLLANGLITSPQLLAAVEYQERHNPRLGELAVELGLLTTFEVERIRALQARQDLRFGDAAKELDLLATEDIERIVAAQLDRHVPLGQAMAALGFLAPDQVERAAAEFLTEEARLQPEVMTIPDDLPLRRVAFELFHLAGRLLTRVCELQAKPEKLRVVTDIVALSDRNVIVTLRGELSAALGGGTLDGAVLLCLPNSIAVDVASRFSGDDAPSDEAVGAVVCELANILCGNLMSVLAEQGARLEVGEPEILPPRVSLPPGRRMALVPFVTHQGLALISLALPPASH